MYTCVIVLIHTLYANYIQWNGQLTITDKGYGPNTGTIVIFTLYDGASNNIRDGSAQIFLYKYYC